MESLDLKKAAAFLGLHPTTLRGRAKAKKIPGAKLGKEWRFLLEDLTIYLRSQYTSNKPQTVNKWQSTSVKVARSTGVGSPSGASKLDEALDRLIRKQPNSLKPVSAQTFSGKV